MIFSMLLLFLIINIVIGALGMAFKITFKLFRWVFGAALAIGIFAFYAIFAVPFAALLVAAVVIYFAFWLVSRVL